MTWTVLDPPAEFKPFRSALDTSPKGLELARPGIMVRLEDGEELLIGDVNELGGGCDDCTVVPHYVKVVAYRDLYAELGIERKESE